MTTANGCTGCLIDIVAPKKYQMSVLLREMQYENCSWALDVLECPRCQHRMRILAAIHPPDATGKILRCLGLPSRAPPLAPAERQDRIQPEWL